jgi:protein SCO1/2
MWGTERKESLKLLMLLVTLAVPVIIFLFLKGFGENHYAVPVFYSQGIPKDTSECKSGNKPHEVDLSDFGFSIQGENQGNMFHHKLSVMDIDIQPAIPLGKAGNPLNRIVDHFTGENSVQFILIRPGQDFDRNKQSLADDRFKYVYGNMNDVSAFARCGLILLDFPGKTDASTRRFVLVDQQGRIRGYYPLSDFDEVDRMILEMKIILEEEY